MFAANSCPNPQLPFRCQELLAGLNTIALRQNDDPIDTAVAPVEVVKRPSILKQITIVVGGQGGLGVCGFATGTIAARILGPAARGELAAIQITGALLATFATLGLSEAATLYCAREPNRARSYVSSAMLLSLIVGAPVFFIGYLAVPYLLSAQTAVVVHAARWYMLIALLYVFFGFPQAALRGLGFFSLWSAFRYVAPAASMGALLVAWMSGRLTPQFIALCGLLTMGLLSAPAVFFILTRSMSGHWRPDPSSWLPMLRFSVPLAISALPKQLNLRLDQMMLAALLPPRLLGLYVVAAAWSTMTGPILEGIGLFLFPHVASKDSLAEQTQALARITRLVTPLAVVEIIGLCFITRWGLVFIFGEAYRGAIPAALILVVASAALYLGQLLEEGLRGLGEPFPILWAELGGLVITGISLLALLRPIGIIGAAISSLLGYTVVWVILMINVSSITALSFTEIVVPRYSEVRSGCAALLSLGRDG